MNGHDLAAKVRPKCCAPCDRREISVFGSVFYRLRFCMWCDYNEDEETLKAMGSEQWGNTNEKVKAQGEGQAD